MFITNFGYKHSFFLMPKEKKSEGREQGIPKNLLTIFQKNNIILCGYAKGKTNALVAFYNRMQAADRVNKLKQQNKKKRKSKKK